MDGLTGSPPAAGIEREIVDFYEKEAGGLLRYAAALAANPETAHDALQEAFFRFFLCRSAGQEIRSPKSWLFRVARNYVLDQKKAGSRNEVGMESLRNLPCPAGRPETDGPVSNLLKVLLEIGLSPREIECIRLRTEDLSYEEIARVLGLQAGTVGALLTRAHGKIRKAVGDGTHKVRGSARAATREKRYAS
ncbi:MAG TPA: RNA polymerase sigma factor [Bryobacteraceae bacterium]|nr:RNA polymerase sigma factor [Bryobacteraceae bacterium]